MSTTTTASTTPTTRPVEAGGPFTTFMANVLDTTAGDLASRRARWADDAVHHITGGSAYAGDLPVDQYLGELLPTFFEQVPDYRFEVGAVLVVGELVAVEWRSSGTLPGDARLSPDGGLLVYRVRGGKVVESWAISGCGDLPF